LDGRVPVELDTDVADRIGTATDLSRDQVLAKAVAVLESAVL
jgi:hypothetical protein